MERLGGLYRRLPAAAIATLAGGAALAALPPFSGFVSEWLGLEALMQGFRVSGTGSHLAIALAGALVALTAGLAALAFVRATGMTFLGMPRDRSIEPGPESRPSRWGMGLLAIASLAIGVAAPWVVKVLEQGLVPVGGAAAIGHISQLGWLVEPGYARLREHQPDGARADADRVRPRRRRASPPRELSPGQAGAGLGLGRSGLRPPRPVHRDRLREHGARDLQRRLPRPDPAADDRRPALPRAAQHDASRAAPVRSRLAVPADHRRIHCGAPSVRNIQAGPLGLYLLYLLLAFIALLLIAPRLG